LAVSLSHSLSRAPLLAGARFRKTKQRNTYTLALPLQIAAGANKDVKTTGGPKAAAAAAAVSARTQSYYCCCLANKR
jgi:hypothetical protein